MEKLGLNSKKLPPLPPLPLFPLNIHIWEESRKCGNHGNSSYKLNTEETKMIVCEIIQASIGN